MNKKEIFEYYKENQDKNLSRLGAECKGDIYLKTACLSCEKCIKQISDLFNRFLYYLKDIECFSEYDTGKTCKLCKSLKPHVYTYCKKDKFMWKYLEDKIFYKENCSYDHFFKKY